MFLRRPIALISQTLGHGSFANAIFNFNAAR
jgi:hypothetical protein